MPELGHPTEAHGESDGCCCSCVDAVAKSAALVIRDLLVVCSRRGCEAVATWTLYEYGDEDWRCESHLPENHWNLGYRRAPRQVQAAAFLKALGASE